MFEVVPQLIAYARTSAFFHDPAAMGMTFVALTNLVVTLYFFTDPGDNRHAFLLIPSALVTAASLALWVLPGVNQPGYMPAATLGLLSVFFIALRAIKLRRT